MNRLQWTLLLGLVFLSFARAEEEEMSEEEIEEEEHGIKFGAVLGLMALSGAFISATSSSTMRSTGCPRRALAC